MSSGKNAKKRDNYWNMQVQDSRSRGSGMWSHVIQIQYPEIKKRCGDTAKMLYCHVVVTDSKDYKQKTGAYLECGNPEHATAFPNDRANKKRFI